MRPDPAEAAVTGLVLTASLDKTAYRPDEEIVLSFELKNRTGKDLFVGDGFMAPGHHETGPGRHFELHVVSAGTSPLYFWSGGLSEGRAGGARRVFRLKPNEIYRGKIVLARPNPKPADDPGGSFEDRTTRKVHVLGRDGQKYTLVLRYTVGDGFGVWEPPTDYRAELLWKGELATKPIPFEVRAG